MTTDLAFHLAGLLCLATMAAVALYIFADALGPNRHKILAALRGEPAALGDTAPRIAAGNPLPVVRADVEPTSDRMPA